MATLSELLDQGILYRIAWYRHHGYGYTEMRHRILRDYPGTDQRTVSAVINRADAGVAAGRLFDAAPDRTRLSLGAIPQGPAGGTGVGYTLYVSFTDEATGRRGARVVRVWDARSIDLGEIRRRAAESLRIILDSEFGSPRKLARGASVTITDYVVASVQRE